MTRKILVADDEPELLEVTLLRLKKTGYDTFGAVEGQEALDLARQQMPDLIILDVYLPFIAGDEVAQILKKDEIKKLLRNFNIGKHWKCRSCKTLNYFEFDDNGIIFKSGLTD